MLLEKQVLTPTSVPDHSLLSSTLYIFKRIRNHFRQLEKRMIQNERFMVPWGCK
jgi:hypothetical protein